jgi:hypothetical protein
MKNKIDHDSISKFLTVALVFVIVFMVTACSTVVPVTAKFPEVPDRLLVSCPQLSKLGDEPKLSDISKTVTINYTTYYECAVKHDALVEWYKIQKDIFDKAGK